PVIVPARLDLKTIRHCPLLSVSAPVTPQVVLVVSSTVDAALAAVRVKSTCSPAAATKPLPSPRFFSSVTVKVCGWPTSLVSLGGSVERGVGEGLSASAVLKKPLM